MVYNQIIIGNIFDVLPQLGKFDVALLSDVIEHFPKFDGFQLTEQLFSHVEDMVISTPLGFSLKNSRSSEMNPYERHISGWTIEDFKRFTIVEYAEVPRITKKGEKILITYLRK